MKHVGLQNRNDPPNNIENRAKEIITWWYITWGALITNMPDCCIMSKVSVIYIAIGAPPILHELIFEILWD